MWLRFMMALVLTTSYGQAYANPTSTYDQKLKMTAQLKQAFKKVAVLEDVLNAAKPRLSAHHFQELMALYKLNLREPLKIRSLSNTKISIETARQSVQFEIVDLEKGTFLINNKTFSFIAGEDVHQALERIEKLLPKLQANAGLYHLLLPEANASLMYVFAGVTLIAIYLTIAQYVNGEVCPTVNYALELCNKTSRETFNSQDFGTALSLYQSAVDRMSFTWPKMMLKLHEMTLGYECSEGAKKLDLCIKKKIHEISDEQKNKLEPDELAILNALKPPQTEPPGKSSPSPQSQTAD